MPPKQPQDNPLMLDILLRTLAALIKERGGTTLPVTMLFGPQGMLIDLMLEPPSTGDCHAPLA